VPREDLIVPGFYGKIPTAGDFVGRGLPGDFVRRWDRWLAQNLAPLIGAQSWPWPLALRFLAGPGCFGPAAGIVLQSTDKAGRRFPLSVVALLPDASIGLVGAEAWFAEIEDAGISAQLGEFTPEELEAALIHLKVPPAEAGEEIVDGMVMWTASSDIYDIDPDAPLPIFEMLLAPRWQVG
jgi:type VI secretion system protein ImpM